MLLSDVLAAGVSRAQAAQGPTPAESSGGSGFVEKLGEAVRVADLDQKSVEAEAGALARGEGDVVETMIQLSRADLSLRFVVQLRNRAIESYREIMRLPL